MSARLNSMYDCAALVGQAKGIARPREFCRRRLPCTEAGRNDRRVKLQYQPEKLESLRARSQVGKQMLCIAAPLAEARKVERARLKLIHFPVWIVRLIDSLQKTVLGIALSHFPGWPIGGPVAVPRSYHSWRSPCTCAHRAGAGHEGGDASPPYFSPGR